MATRKVPTDFIEFGSKEHADFLGLIPDKDSEFGYRLADTTAFGPQVTENFLREVLRQKVAELKSGKPKVPPGSPALFYPKESPGYDPNIPIPIPT